MEQLNNARKVIHIQAYQFSSVAIAKAVVEARKRGVDVVVVLDASQKSEEYSSATFFRERMRPAEMI